MKYFTLEPEVAGGFGEKTIMDPTKRPPAVSKFHYEFEGWMGDELLETVACFIATSAVVEKLQTLTPSGVEFDQVEISKSAAFKELYPDRILPDFMWLKITGVAGQHDFGLSRIHRLVVSERVLFTLRSRNLQQCRVAPYKA